MVEGAWLRAHVGAPLRLLWGSWGAIAKPNLILDRTGWKPIPRMMCMIISVFNVSKITPLKFKIKQIPIVTAGLCTTHTL